MRNLITTTSLLFTLPLMACMADGDPQKDVNNDPPLSDVDTLFADAPANDTLPDENKADAQYPEQYTGPIQWQSPVKSQGRRGVCSIFSTVALMEHLYIKEGSMANPDFSEQYLQWSAKEQVRSFRNTSGSNARSNLQAISQYGIVLEGDDPYETNQWGPSDDAECEGDEMPTKCYTNGSPDETAMAARKWKLPRGRWLNTNSIKAHMHSKDQGVVVGLTFFYQSWNHRRSQLPTDRGYWAKGYVLYPNDKDKEISLEKRAGHSILLVGWDDTLEVQKVDEEGNKIVDDEGNPVMEKGFYVFKNSWGTGSFGKDNPHGDGYGFISMAYVHRYGSAYVSNVPQLNLSESCDDGTDDDFDGAVDCDDSDCADALECQSGDLEAVSFESSHAPLSIPDNDPVGIHSDITVERSGTVRKLEVEVDITHTYRGDLRVILDHDGQSIVLQDRSGGGVNDLQKTFEVSELLGGEMNGEWRLRVEDRAGVDTGSLNSWKLSIVTDRQQ